MRYLCLGHHDERKWNAVPEAERKAVIDESLAYAAELRSRGHLMDDVALQEAMSAVTLRFREGDVAITDGPYAETKEQLGGLMLLEARDLNEAIQLMSQIPCMRLGGSIEIRPVNEAISTQRPAAVELTVAG